MIYSAKKRFEEADVFGKSTEDKAFAQYFIGNSYLNPKTDARCGLFLANVTFEPGCRSNWHIHHARKGGGQILICAAGEGTSNERCEPVCDEGFCRYNAFPEYKKGSAANAAGP